MKKQAAQAAAPIDVEVVDQPVSEDHSLVSTETNRLRQFLGGLVPFFRGALALERKASDVLGQATLAKTKFKTTLPTQGEDTQLQINIRAARIVRKEIDEYWKITALFSKLHKMLVAGRERGGGQADEAVTITQTIHNRYVTEATRKAKEETDRIRSEEEQRAQADRDRELVELEQQALALEARSPDLSERETRFVELMFTGVRTVEESARVAGFKDPAAQGERLMRHPKIRSAIKARQEALAIRRQASAQAQQPVSVNVETVKPAITRAAGVSDRGRWSAELYDAEALLVAVLDPATRTKLGIPSDVVMVNPVKLNGYAASLQSKMDTWPGVRAQQNVSTV